LETELAQPLLFTHNHAPGDIAVMTAAVRDLALTYPGEYDIYVATAHAPLWELNPHIAGMRARGFAGGMQSTRLDYGPYLNRARTDRQHFITSFHRAIAKKLERAVPVLLPKPDLHLSDEHKANSPVSGRYWVILAGGKWDFTAKIWSGQRWQQTVDLLLARGIQCVQCGVAKAKHIQPTLSNVLNLVNRTSLRELLRLIYHADGVICHVTCAMHMAAAFDKPCVVIAGGREHWWWEAYVNTDLKAFGPAAAPVAVPHRYLHTQGMLDCCREYGCWRSKLTRDEPDRRNSYCKRPCDDGYGQKHAGCLHLITPQHVTDAVLSYYGNN
jgi:ADP-heptose:LPS heptosyltransferase